MVAGTTRAMHTFPGHHFVAVPSGVAPEPKNILWRYAAKVADKDTTINIA